MNRGCRSVLWFVLVDFLWRWNGRKVNLQFQKDSARWLVHFQESQYFLVRASIMGSMVSF